MQATRSYGGILFSKKLSQAKLCGTSLAPVSKHFIVSLVEKRTKNVLRALIDTGSDNSFLSESMKSCFNVKRCNMFSCLSFNSNSVCVNEYCEVAGTIHNTYFSGQFYIAALPSHYDMILGSDFLSRYGAMISYDPHPVITFRSINSSCSSTTERNFDIGDNLSVNQLEDLQKLLDSFDNIFSCGPHDLGRTSVLKHAIDTGGSAPIKQRSYKLPHGMKEESRAIIQEMLSNGVIQKSTSPWSNPFFLVKKKNGKYRFVLNFRKLNEVTKKDAFPIPLIDEIFAELHGASLFTSLDLTNGYWQMELEECSKEKTAFTTDNELYEFNVMPYGVCNGPSSFQRAMRMILKDAPCLPPYIDDVVVASDNWVTHLHDLSEVLTKIKESGLKLNPEKCSFAKESIIYLGHLISKEGIRPDPAKVSALVNLKSPENPKEVQIVFGFCNYLRNYVPNFADIMKPISCLLHLKPKDFMWTKEAEDAFKSVKKKIASGCLRHYPDFTKPFELSVDASSTAIGASLTQSGQPVVFDSRVLTKAEQNYSTTDREYLALVWAFKKFREYLVNHDCIVITDHKPLLGLVKGSPRNSRHARYQQILEEFHFDFQYIPGEENIVADTLSRLTTESIVNGCTSASSVDAIFGDIQQFQKDDKECQKIVHSLKQNEPFDSPLRCPEEWTVSEDEVLLHSGRPYVPVKMRSSLTKSFHEVGHFGVNTTVKKMRERYIFPGMWSTVSNFVKRCSVCQQLKNYGPKKAPMLSLPEAGPFELVCIDIVGPVKLSGNFKYILTMLDNYSKWVEAVPLTSIDADTVSKAFIKNWIFRWGPPVILHSDRGTQFESSVMTAICQMLGTKKTRTTAYHPEGNGSLERFHRNLKDRLRCSKRNWKEVLDEVLFEYRIMPNSTGEAPIKRLMGFDVPIPSDWPQKFVRNYFHPSVHMLHDTFSHVSKTQKVAQFVNRYNVGQSVWVKCLNRSSSDPPWKGPYVICDVLGPVTLKLEQFGSIHVNRCKLAI